MELLAIKILLVFLYVTLGAVLFSTALGVPGNWILVGAALVAGYFTHFDAMSWRRILLCAGLATAGEIFEAVVGAATVAGKGGSRWAVAGSMAGAWVGVVGGAGVIPPLGSVAFGFIGAFAGAVGGELIRQRRMEPALRIGFWAFVGRMAAMAGKLAVGVVIWWIIVQATWP